MHYYKHILVPVDLGHGEVGEHILRVGKSMVGDKGKITLITVLEHAPSYVTRYMTQEAMVESLREAHEKLSALAHSVGVEANIVLCEGNAVGQILEEADKAGCDVIIIGSHRPNYRDYFIGSTAAGVVRRAQITVVVERTGPLLPADRR